MYNYVDSYAQLMLVFFFLLNYETKLIISQCIYLQLSNVYIDVNVFVFICIYINIYYIYMVDVIFFFLSASIVHEERIQMVEWAIMGVVLYHTAVFFSLALSSILLFFIAISIYSSTAWPTIFSLHSITIFNCNLKCPWRTAFIPTDIKLSNHTTKLILK